MRDVISQGDVVFVPVAVLPSGEKRKIADGIIARGESTGHTHAIADLETGELIEVDGKRYILRLGEGTVSITHPEHGDVILDAPIYEVHIDKTFDYTVQGLRNVAD